MREIKFRGKRIDNGEWVVGDLTRYSGEMSYITVDLVEGEVHQVYAETVCQFIGLKDKNGVDIYEGEIVITDECGWIGHVVYGTDMYYVEDDVGGYASYCNWNNYEVIGNIHTPIDK